jgi:hypothetical protein
MQHIQNIHSIQQTYLVVCRIIRKSLHFSGDEIRKYSHLTFMEIEYTNTYNIIQCSVLIQAVISEKNQQYQFHVRIKAVKSNQKSMLAVIVWPCLIILFLQFGNNFGNFVPKCN